tara:strand:+ start:65 stop:1009 length:945 start_codon:yes stop_codon:yes gene_type:complete
MAQQPRKKSPFKKILNPDTKGLPRETFEYLYPDKKTITVPKALRGVTKPARRMPMQKPRKALGPTKPSRTYKKQEGGIIGAAKDFFKTGKLFGITPTKPEGQTVRGGANSVTGKIEKRLSVKEKKAAKRQADFDKATRPAGMSTEGNISKAGKQGKAMPVGTRTGAKPKNQFPKTKGAYTIKKGDTLSSIAKARGTTVAAILKANPGIKDKNKIRAGAGLKGIPGLQGSSTIKNIADAGPKGKPAAVGTKYGELYEKKKKKKKTTSKGERGKRDFLNIFKPTDRQKQRRADLKAKFGKAQGGMASMDDYLKDLL